MFNLLCVIAVCADDRCLVRPAAQHGEPPRGKEASRGAALSRSSEAVYSTRFVVVFIGFITDPHNQLLSQTNQMLSRYSL